MSLLDQLRGELSTLSPTERAQFLDSIGAPAAEPAAPPTALDDLRATSDYSELDLVVSEIPGVHELPILVGILVKRVYALEREVGIDRNEDDTEPSPVSAAPSETPVSAAPAPSTPAPAPGVPAPEPAPPAQAVEAAPTVTPQDAATNLPPVPTPPAE